MTENDLIVHDRTFKRHTDAQGKPYWCNGEHSASFQVSDDGVWHAQWGPARQSGATPEEALYNVSVSMRDDLLRQLDTNRLWLWLWDH